MSELLKGAQADGAPAPARPGSPAQSIQQVREAYRTEEMPRLYEGHLHFLFTSLFGLGGIALCVWLMRDVTWPELLTIPVTFLYANLAEYLGHRGPMHRRKKYAPIVFDGHTGIHHRFFTEDDFAYEGHRDWHALLLPPYMIVFFFGLFTVPIGVLLYFVVSPNVAYLFVATGLGYFVGYEWLHFCYHAPEDSVLLRLPFMRSLRKHHMTHHNPRLMTRYNFNITFPIFDWLLRTTYHGERKGPAGGPSPADQLAEGPVADFGGAVGAQEAGQLAPPLGVGPHPQAGDAAVPPEQQGGDRQQPAP